MLHRRDLTRELEATAEAARLQERHVFLNQEADEVSTLELLRALELICSYASRCSENLKQYPPLSPYYPRRRRASFSTRLFLVDGIWATLCEESYLSSSSEHAPNPLRANALVEVNIKR